MPSASLSPVSTCSPTQKLSEPYTFEIFMEASSRMHDRLLNPLPAPLLPPERVEWGRNFQASNYSWVFLLTSVTGGQSHFIRTKDILVT